MMSEGLFQPEVLLATLGFFIIFSGVSSLALFFLRRKQQDLSLLAFGTAALLYGMRFLAEMQLDLSTESAPHSILISFVAVATYVMPVPLSGFLLFCFGSGWKKAMLWVFRASVLFAGAGILSDLIQRTPLSLVRLNNVLVTAWAVLTAAHAFWPGLKKTAELKIVFIGFSIFGLFALNDNLVSLNAVPWSWQGEEYGFLAFLLFLGYVTARRFLNNESRLLAVERELETARRIQESILPKALPRLTGWEMAARYLPMMSVAGDFYDVLNGDKSGLCILIADVSGHGVGAALIASMLKVAFASQREHMEDPSRLLFNMNRSLHGRIGNDFITAACGYIDTTSGTIRYAAAGHPPTLLHRKKSLEILKLDQNGLIIGPFADVHYPLMTMTLEPGDRLIFYTDGITEAEDRAGSLFGEEAFQRRIEGGKGLDASSFAEQLIKSILEWSGRPPGQSLDDDLTLFVVDRTG